MPKAHNHAFSSAHTNVKRSVPTIKSIGTEYRSLTNGSPTDQNSPSSYRFPTELTPEMKYWLTMPCVITSISRKMIENCYYSPIECSFMSLKDVLSIFQGVGMIQLRGVDHGRHWQVNYAPIIGHSTLRTNIIREILFKESNYRIKYLDFHNPWDRLAMFRHTFP
ncbi:uncharacterized protein BYT42DRAFT_574353 [Radiomyces spectabilis]|uniref:uncharacterized protein n=1 Tax=Radiomyces spectabilis TaxID=64574 RepID=UPI00221F3867|nr:uncharacterized protein BYT42DRAFT_574353 [Radiomyces spectabilis]KAI8376369.1 hypothetical protein BYT42DRAFT_574353 [Radiomyces spectabilis]